MVRSFRREFGRRGMRLLARMNTNTERSAQSENDGPIEGDERTSSISNLRRILFQRCVTSPTTINTSFHSLFGAVAGWL